MASEYRQVHPRFWDSTRGMDTDVHLMAVYCLTAPGSNAMGIFVLSCARAGEDLGLSSSGCRTLLDKVCGTLNWRYDEDARVLFIPTWWRWNCPHNASHMVGCLKRLESLPQTLLLQEFALNEEHLKSAPAGVLNTFRRGVAHLTTGCPTQNQNQNQNPDQKQNLSAASAAKKERPKTDHAPTSTKKVQKPREPSPIWDAVCDLFALKPVTGSECARVGKIVRDLKEKEATPEDIRARAKRLEAEYGQKCLTPESLVKHWDRYAADAQPDLYEKDFGHA